METKYLVMSEWEDGQADYVLCDTRGEAIDTAKADVGIAGKYVLDEGFSRSSIFAARSYEDHDEDPILVYERSR